MSIICDRCRNYEALNGGVNEICYAYHDEYTPFKCGITKPYIEERMIGEKKHCKEFKRI